MSSLISILAASDVAQFYFLDGDQSGKNRAQRYTTDFELQGLTTKDSTELPDSSIEDLIPRETYLKAVKLSYNLSDIALEENGMMITRQVKKFLQSKDMESIDKQKITKKLVPLLKDNPNEILETFEPIFKKINEIKNNLKK